MDKYCEKHFQEWLTSEYTWRHNVHRKKVETAIRDFLDEQQERRQWNLIEDNYSWPEIRTLALHRLGILI
jgi:hypothetical protein